MLPAQQRLETDDAAVDTRLRLVVQRELAARQGILEIEPQRPALTQLPVHRRREETDATAPLSLGLVQGRLRVADERGGALPVERKDRDADADGDIQRVAGDTEIVRQGRLQPVRQRLGGQGLRAGRDQDELVAADTCQEDAFRRPLHALAGAAQQRVAN